MLVDMNTRDCDSEWYSWGGMTLNVKTQKDGDSRCLNGQCTMALNAKLKKDDGIECLNEHEKRLWTPKLKKIWWLKIHEWVWKIALNAKLRKIVNQNAWRGTKDGSERQGWRKNANGYGCGYETTTPNWEWITALNAKVQMWLWTPNGKWMMALNAN